VFNGRYVRREIELYCFRLMYLQMTVRQYLLSIRKSGSSFYRTMMLLLTFRTFGISSSSLDVSSKSLIILCNSEEVRRAAYAGL
jgi:hypothetical protein